MKNKILDLALKSLVLEVSLYPKPGLVDPLDSGSHSDMDYFLFLESCFALSQGFEKYLEDGENHTGSSRELFDKIRHTGMLIEHDMYAATDNVNTHKGANFLYGVVLSAIAFLDYPSLDVLQEEIKKMTEGLVFEELGSLKEYKTHGEKVFNEFGFTGIRGEVEEGLPLVFNHALPTLKSTNNREEGMKLALLELIKHNNDSNMLKRGGFEGLTLGKDLALKPYKDLDKHLLEMNDIFKEYNLSPGGTADLLALSVFLQDYEQLLNK